MTDEDVVTSIEVVCSSSRHARGKVAKIATFRRTRPGAIVVDGYYHPAWTGGAPYLPKKGKRENERIERSVPPNRRAEFNAGGVYDFEIPQLLAPLRCKLCDTERPNPSGRKRDELLDSFAAQGKSLIELKQLPAARI